MSILANCEEGLLVERVFDPMLRRRKYKRQEKTGRFVFEISILMLYFTRMLCVMGTLPEPNIALKMDGWNTIVSFWDGLFSVFRGFGC